MTIQRSVLVATPASAALLNLDALQMFQAFLDEVSFAIEIHTNDAVVVYANREDKHKLLTEKIDEKFPGRFRTQSVPESLLN